MENYQKLHSFGLGMAIGVLWGASVILMAVLTMFTEYGGSFVATIGQYYLGYEATWLGAVIGGIWALVDGFVGGFLIAWLYNKFSCCKCPARG